MKSLSSLFLGFGRLARGPWLFKLVGLGVVCAAFGLLAGEIAGEGGKALFAAVFLWSAMALSVQRLHDTGRSGTTMLLLLIPVLGPAWVLLLLCRRGGEGRNRYGLDPLARLDYLRVDITK